MLSKATDESVSGECLMSVKQKGVLEAREFHVRATPLSINGDKVTIFTFHDISAWKRREFMDSVFLHDTLNIVTSIRNWSEMLRSSLCNPDEVAAKIVDLSNRLNREVQHQRLMLQAERGELQPNHEICSCSSLFNGLRSIFDSYRSEGTSRFIIRDPPQNHYFRTDQELLARILINMIKNGLEASEPEGCVTLWFELRDGSPGFFVNNPGSIPEDAQLKIFQRSYSTKSGRGRGIGCYSMKLFGERYLGGEVSFTSNETEGTTFFFILPSTTLASMT